MVLDLDRLLGGRLLPKGVVPASTGGGLAIAGVTTDSPLLRVLSILETFFVNKLLEGEVMPAQLANSVVANGKCVSGASAAYTAPAVANHDLTWDAKVAISENLSTVSAVVGIAPKPVLGNAVPAEQTSKKTIKGTFGGAKETKTSVTNSNPLLFTLEIDGIPFPPFLINETNQSTLENAVWKLTEEGVIDIFKPQVDYKALPNPEIIEFLGEQIEVFSEFQTKIENPTQQISAPIISIMIALIGIAQGLEIGNEDTIKTGILMIVTNLLLMQE